MGQVGQRSVVSHVGGRIGDGLGVQHAGRPGAEGGIHGIEVGRVDDLDLDPEPTEHPDHLDPGRAIDRERRHDPITGPDERGEHGMDGGHPGRQRDAAFTTGEFRVRAPEGGGRRVGDAAVGIASPAVADDATEFLRVRRGERGGLVDRHGGRRLVDLRGARCRTDGAGREASGDRSGPRVGIAHGAMLHRRGRAARSWRGNAGHPVLAGALRGVHRPVRADDQFIGGAPVVRVGHDADRQ